MIGLRQQKLLVIAPHPDDEVLGCGGLIQKVKNENGQVFVLFLTVGDTKDFSKTGFSSSQERQEEIMAVSELLRFDEYHVAFPGNDFHLKLDELGQKVLMDLIERESPLSLERLRPTIVAFPSLASYNQDHRVAALAAHAALRPANDPKYLVPTVLAYEGMADGWTLQRQEESNFFIPLSAEELETKLSAMALYRSQVRPAPHPRSLPMIRTFSQLRGAQSGTDFAEGFTIYRTIYSPRNLSSSEGTVAKTAFKIRKKAS